MNSTGIILTLAYPETVVQHAEEWYSPFLKYVGIGNKTHVRAGHAALVLIHNETGDLEYHDFGRYITPEPHGRVRGKDTDGELNFPISAKIENQEITNLEDILVFLATHPKFTHGDGTLYASVCKAIDYHQAKKHIVAMQDRHFIRYAAFVKEACNCARFVTDTIIASTTDIKIKKRLIRSKWFTPSTVGNVIIADTEKTVYKISEMGEIDTFSDSVSKINRVCFLDKLQGHDIDYTGTLLPKSISSISESAQWLSGIAAGAWFELHPTSSRNEFRFKRISPHEHVDIDGIYEVDDTDFILSQSYRFVQYSNCKFFHVEQNNKMYRFDLKAALVKGERRT